MRKPLELYIHVPFCVKKCAYCDFLSFPADDRTKADYVDRLIQEMEHYAPYFKESSVETIFFGGGTPTTLNANQITRIIDAITKNFHIGDNPEVTLEANPGTIDKLLVKMMASSGINRLSLGLQSANPQDLQLMERIHTYEDFLISFDHARHAGIKNINVDVMSGLPRQTQKMWENTLKKVVAVRPEHISAYSLIIEPGTKFYSMFGNDEKLRADGKKPFFLPTEEAEREMYEITKEFLGKKGYKRYEISNYARPGFECRHNIGYWTGVEYLGLGLGASSYVDGYRFKNTSDLGTYMTRTFDHAEDTPLSRADMIEEFMFLGLRMTEGISCSEFEKRFGFPIDAQYSAAIEKLKSEGLLVHAEDRIYLTDKGIDVSNYALAEFLIER